MPAAVRHVDQAADGLAAARGGDAERDAAAAQREAVFAVVRRAGQVAIDDDVAVAPAVFPGLTRAARVPARLRLDPQLDREVVGHVQRHLRLDRDADAAHLAAGRRLEAQRVAGGRERRRAVLAGGSGRGRHGGRRLARRLFHRGGRRRAGRAIRAGSRQQAQGDHEEREGSNRQTVKSKLNRLTRAASARVRWRWQSASSAAPPVSDTCPPSSASRPRCGTPIPGPCSRAPRAAASRSAPWPRGP